MHAYYTNTLIGYQLSSFEIVYRKGQCVIRNGKCMKVMSFNWVLDPTVSFEKASNCLVIRNGKCMEILNFNFKP